METGSRKGAARRTDFDLALEAMWRNSHRHSLRSEPELLDCPFCGGKPVLLLRQRLYELRAAVQCTGCGANTGPVDRHGDLAVRLWNRRATPRHEPRPTGTPANPEDPGVFGPLPPVALGTFSETALRLADRAARTPAVLPSPA